MSDDTPETAVDIPDRHNTMIDLQYKLLEKGKLPTAEAYTLSLVTTGLIPYEEYQELLSHRWDHNSRRGSFLAQIVLSGLISTFSMGMLLSGGDAGVYLPILTGILGYWLPSPNFAKQHVNKKSYSKDHSSESFPREQTPN